MADINLIALERSRKRLYVRENSGPLPKRPRRNINESNSLNENKSKLTDEKETSNEVYSLRAKRKNVSSSHNIQKSIKYDSKSSRIKDEQTISSTKAGLRNVSMNKKTLIIPKKVSNFTLRKQTTPIVNNTSKKNKDSTQGNNNLSSHNSKKSIKYDSKSCKIKREKSIPPSKAGQKNGTEIKKTCIVPKNKSNINIKNENAPVNDTSKKTIHSTQDSNNTWEGMVTRSISIKSSIFKNEVKRSYAKLKKEKTISFKNEEHSLKKTDKENGNNFIKIKSQTTDKVSNIKKRNNAKNIKTRRKNGLNDDSLETNEINLVTNAPICITNLPYYNATQMTLANSREVNSYFLPAKGDVLNYLGVALNDKSNSIKNNQHEMRQTKDCKEKLCTAIDLNLNNTHIKKSINDPQSGEDNLLPLPEFDKSIYKPFITNTPQFDLNESSTGKLNDHTTHSWSTLSEPLLTNMSLEKVEEPLKTDFAKTKSEINAISSSNIADSFGYKTDEHPSPNKTFFAGSTNSTSLLDKTNYVEVSNLTNQSSQNENSSLHSVFNDREIVDETPSGVVSFGQPMTKSCISNDNNNYLKFDNTQERKYINIDYKNVFEFDKSHRYMDEKKVDYVETEVGLQLQNNKLNKSVGIQEKYTDAKSSENAKTSNYSRASRDVKAPLLSSSIDAISAEWSSSEDSISPMPDGNCKEPRLIVNDRLIGSVEFHNETNNEENSENINMQPSVANPMDERSSSDLSENYCIAQSKSEKIVLEHNSAGFAESVDSESSNDDLFTEENFKSPSFMGKVMDVIFQDKGSYISRQYKKYLEREGKKFHNSGSAILEKNNTVIVDLDLKSQKENTNLPAQVALDPNHDERNEITWEEKSKLLGNIQHSFGNLDGKDYDMQTVIFNEVQNDVCSDIILDDSSSDSNSWENFNRRPFKKKVNRIDDESEEMLCAPIKNSFSGINCSLNVDYEQLKIRRNKKKFVISNFVRKRKVNNKKYTTSDKTAESLNNFHKSAKDNKSRSNSSQVSSKRILDRSERVSTKDDLPSNNNMHQFSNQNVPEIIALKSLEENSKISTVVKNKIPYCAKGTEESKIETLVCNGVCKRDTSKIIGENNGKPKIKTTNFIGSDKKKLNSHSTRKSVTVVSKLSNDFMGFEKSNHEILSKKINDYEKVINKKSNIKESCTSNSNNYDNNIDNSNKFSKLSVDKNTNVNSQFNKKSKYNSTKNSTHDNMCNTEENNEFIFTDEPPDKPKDLSNLENSISDLCDSSTVVSNIFTGDSREKEESKKKVNMKNIVCKSNKINIKSFIEEGGYSNVSQSLDTPTENFQIEPSSKMYNDDLGSSERIDDLMTINQTSIVVISDDHISLDKKDNLSSDKVSKITVGKIDKEKQFSSSLDKSTELLSTKNIDHPKDIKVLKELSNENIDYKSKEININDGESCPSNSKDPGGVLVTQITNIQTQVCPKIEKDISVLSEQHDSIKISKKSMIELSDEKSISRKNHFSVGPISEVDKNEIVECGSIRKSKNKSLKESVSSNIGSKESYQLISADEKQNKLRKAHVMDTKKQFSSSRVGKLSELVSVGHSKEIEKLSDEVSKEKIDLKEINKDGTIEESYTPNSKDSYTVFVTQNPNTQAEISPKTEKDSLVSSEQIDVKQISKSKLPCKMSSDIKETVKYGSHTKSNNTSLKDLVPLEKNCHSKGIKETDEKISKDNMHSISQEMKKTNNLELSHSSNSGLINGQTDPRLKIKQNAFFPSKFIKRHLSIDKVNKISLGKNKIAKREIIYKNALAKKQKKKLLREYRKRILNCNTELFNNNVNEYHESEKKIMNEIPVKDYLKANFVNTGYDVNGKLESVVLINLSEGDSLESSRDLNNSDFDANEEFIFSEDDRVDDEICSKSEVLKHVTFDYENNISSKFSSPSKDSYSSAAFIDECVNEYEENSRSLSSSSVSKILVSPNQEEFDYSVDGLRCNQSDGIDAIELSKTSKNTSVKGLPDDEKQSSTNMLPGHCSVNDEPSQEPHSSLLKPGKTLVKVKSQDEELLEKYFKTYCIEKILTNRCKLEVDCKNIHFVPKGFLDDFPKEEIELLIKTVIKLSTKISTSFLSEVFLFFGRHAAQLPISSLAGRVLSKIFVKSKPNKCYLREVSNYFFDAFNACELSRAEAMAILVKYNTKFFSTCALENIDCIFEEWDLSSPLLHPIWPIIKPLIHRPGLSLSEKIVIKLLVEAKNSTDLDCLKFCADQLLLVQEITVSVLNKDYLENFLKKLLTVGLRTLAKKLIAKIPDCTQFTKDDSLKATAPTTSMKAVQSPKSHIEELNTLAKSELEQVCENAIHVAVKSGNYRQLVHSITVYSEKNMKKLVMKCIFDCFNEEEPLVMTELLVKEFINHSEFNKYTIFCSSLICSFVIYFSKNSLWEVSCGFIHLFEKFKLERYKLQEFIACFSPLRLALIYSEVYFQNYCFKESFNEISKSFLQSHSKNSELMGNGNEDNSYLQQVLLKSYLSEHLNYKRTEFAADIFNLILKKQYAYTSGIDLTEYFEVLANQLFDCNMDERPLDFYIALRKIKYFPLFGLTIRVLVIMAYRRGDYNTLTQLFKEGLAYGCYPSIMTEKYAIILVKSFTEEEMICYLVEWFLNFKKRYLQGYETIYEYFVKNKEEIPKFYIRFKEENLSDFLDHKSLGVPPILQEVDESIEGCTMRLETVLKIVNLKLKRKENTLLIKNSRHFIDFLKKI